MRHAIVAMSLLAVLGGASSAAGQTAAGQTAAPRGGTTIAANVFGGYDAPLFATDALATLQPSSQSFGGGDLSYGYLKTGRRLSVGVSANASSNYYPKFTPKLQPSYGLSATMSSTTQGRWSWGLSGFALYAPLANTGLFAGALTQNGSAFALNSGTAFQVSTVRQIDGNAMASLSYSPTRRTHVQLIGAVGTLVPLQGTLPDNLRLNGRLRLARDLSRNFRGYVGYSVSQNRVAAYRDSPATHFVIDGFEVGVDFSRPFQLTRNTTLNFSTGLLNVPDSGTSTYQVTGNVTLDHQFRRNWMASLTAMRDARFVQTFKDPAVYSGVSASTGGMLAGSLGATLSANYSRGAFNGQTISSSFETYSTSARLRYDLLRRVATFIEYSLFRSDIEATTDLAGYPTGAFGRYSIRVGLSLGLNPYLRPASR